VGIFGTHDYVAMISTYLQICAIMFSSVQQYWFMRNFVDLWAPTCNYEHLYAIMCNNNAYLCLIVNIFCTYVRPCAIMWNYVQLQALISYSNNIIITKKSLIDHFSLYLVVGTWLLTMCSSKLWKLSSHSSILCQPGFNLINLFFFITDAQDKFIKELSL